MSRQSGIADLIVKAAIVVITAAFFIGLYLQFQMSFWGALLGAASVYTVLLLFHALRRRSEREKELEYAVNRLEDEVARAKVAPRGEAMPAGAGRMPKIATARVASAPAVAPTPPPVAPAAPPMASAPPPMPPAPPVAPAAAAGTPAVAAKRAPRIFRSAPEAAKDPLEPRLTAQRPGADQVSMPRSEPALTVPPLTVPAAAPPAEHTLRAQPPQADLPPMPKLPDWSAPPAAPAASGWVSHDYWPSASGKPSLPEGPRVELPPLAAGDRETDLDAVHGMIKRLADEVNINAEPTLEGMPPQRQESVLRASLNALQTTASVMRAPSKKSPLPTPSTAQRAGGPTPPPIMPSHARLATLAEAVSSGRIEASLAPVVGLADHQLHYYEVVASPRDERGNLLSTSTRDPQLAIAGLLPMLDGARLRQAAQVARILSESGRHACLFVPATAVSLANDGFLDELADTYRAREALANEVVLTFAQADVRTFGGSEWSALTDMRDLGFRFGVEDVTDFDYEFTALCAAGFAFVKLDAATLLAGLPGPSGTMPADEICRSLSELGLTVIVTGIDDEATRDRVLAAGVPLGQGALFGPPVPAGTNTFAAAGDAAA